MAIINYNKKVKDGTLFVLKTFFATDEKILVIHTKEIW